MKNEKVVKSMKDKITKHSVRLFREKGFSETSIQDIVDSLEVTKGTFYYYFKSKEELLMDIHERYIDDLLARQQRIIDKGQNAAQTLTAIIELIIGDIQFHQADGVIYLREMRNLSPENTKKIKVKRSKFRQAIEYVLEEGRKSGEFHKDLHPKMISFAVLGVTNWTYNWVDAEGDISLDELAKMYADFVLYGVHQ